VAVMRAIRNLALWVPVLAALALLACGTEPNTEIRAPFAPDVPSGWDTCTNTPAPVVLCTNVCGLSTNGVLLAWEPRPDIVEYHVLRGMNTNAGAAQPATGGTLFENAGELTVYVDTTVTGPGLRYFWVEGVGTSGKSSCAGPLAVNVTSLPTATDYLTIDIDTELSFSDDDVPPDLLLFLTSDSGGQKVVIGPFVASGTGRFHAAEIVRSSLLSVPYTLHGHAAGYGWLEAPDAIAVPGTYIDPDLVLQ
jgi:hypothetical protein